MHSDAMSAYMPSCIMQNMYIKEHIYTLLMYVATYIALEGVTKLILWAGGSVTHM